MSIKIKQRKPYLVKEVGEWKFTFHYKEGSIDKTFLSITSTSGLMNMRIGGNCHAFGYLLAAAKQNLDHQLQGYIATLFIPAMAMTQDQELVAGVQDAIRKWQNRKDEEAKAAAEAITDTEEEANQAFMEDVVAETDMSKKELKAKREADKEVMREIIFENPEEEKE